MNKIFLRDNLESIKNNTDFAQRGEEIVRSGKIRLGPFPAVDYVLDWQQDPLQNRTWQWRWGSLSALMYLIAHHAKTGDERALLHGMQLIESWASLFVSSEPEDETLSEFVWHDHGSAMRAEHTLLFLAHITDASTSFASKDLCLRFVPIANELLEKHAITLARDSFYSSNTNHGLEQARILLLLSSTFEDAWEMSPTWRTLAHRRLQAELDFAFTVEGVHVENSPAYHIFVFKTFISIIQTYSHLGTNELKESFLPKAKKILEYITYILRPDGKTPILGDTEKLRPSDAFHGLLGDTREYQEFRYALTAGKSGTQPRARFRVYPKSGYVIYRDTWNNRHALHAIVKAGALSSYHRQEDEGNLLVYAFGEDWLIDSGMYNYNQGDPVRKYVRSRAAHNIPVINGTLYKKDWAELKNCWALIDERLTGTNNQTTFTFHGLVDASIERTTQFEPRRITVRDTLINLDGTLRSAKTQWHVDDRKTVEVVDGKTVMVRSKDSSNSMLIRTQGASLDNVIVRRGMSGTRVVSVTSDLANQYKPSTVIEFVCHPAATHELKTEITFTQQA